MSEPNGLSRAFVSRILFGGAIGAAIGIMYLVYIRQRKKEDQTSDGTTVASSMARKKKRVSSGERNRVTFSDQTEIIVKSPSPQLTKDDMEAEDFTPFEVKNVDAQPAQPSSPQINKSPAKTEVDSIPATQKSPPRPAQEKDDSINKEVSIKKEEPIKNPSPAVETVTAEEIKPQASSPQSQTLSNSVNHAANGHGQNLKQAITPETDYDRTGIVRELQISRDHVPGLIGKKGTHIRSVQADSNTIITFKDESLANGDRICLIRGQPQDVTVAESLIEKYITQQPIVTSQTMHIPHSSVGRIIGKGGENIRGIQDLTRAKVNVDTGNQFHSSRGGPDAVRMVLVTLRGTEEQISSARQMIIEKVDEEQSMRRKIDMMTQSRAPRKSAGSGFPTTSASSAAVNGNHQSAKQSGVLEVFVSCAYHPNDFWIQVMGHESIELDKLTESMTEWYSQFPPEPLLGLSTGEIIAAPFDVDGKMYRGKIISLVDDTAEVSYVDYGDRRVIQQSDIRRIHPEFLKLRFQANQATLNLGCTGERWSDDTIVAFCDLTYCAQWRSLTAKVKDYLKGSSDSKETVLWVELLDKDLNIGNELINRGLATINDTPQLTYSDTPHSSSVASSNGSKKSYASVASLENKVSDDGSKEGPWDDNVNGN